MVERQLGYWQLLRQNPNFTRLYFARVISLFGDWFNLLAVMVLMRELGEDGAFVLGGIFIAKSLANLIMLPFSGVIVDRFSRKWAMLLSDVGRACSVGLMFLVLIYPSVWLVYGLLLLQSALSAFFEPARSALLPDIVTAEELTAANALGAATWSAMLAIGSAFGGVFTEFFGWKWALLVDVGSYLFSAALLWWVFEPSFVRKKSDFFEEMMAGLRYLRDRFDVWTLSIAKALWSIVGSVTVLLTLMGEGKYRLGAGTMISVAILFMARGVGTGLGPIFSRMLSRSDPRTMERFIGLGYVLGAVFFSVIPFVNSIWLVGLCLIGAHIGGATTWVFSSIRLQQLVETEIRGRIFSWELVFFLSVNILSIYAYSWGLDAYDLPADKAFHFLGVSLLLPLSFWTWRMKRLR